MGVMIRVTMSEEVTYLHDFTVSELAELLDLPAETPIEELIEAVHAFDENANDPGLVDKITRYVTVNERSWEAVEVRRPTSWEPTEEARWTR